MPESQVRSASIQEPSGETGPSQAAPLPEVLLNQKLLNAIPIMAMVLDVEGRIVFSNRALVEFAGASDVEQLRGLRPGAALGCVHATEPPDGCTTTESCAFCGGRSVITAARIGRAASGPYRLRRFTPRGEEAVDLHVQSAPVVWGGQSYTMVCVMDVGDKLRRHALERFLFQAAFRLAESIKTLAASLERPQPPDHQQATIKVIAALSRMLTEELQSHSDLAAAERGDLEVRRASIQSLKFLRELVKDRSGRVAEPGTRVALDPAAEDCEFSSDPVLLGRVVGHMVENACEACSPGETVTVGCRREGDAVEFWVHNPGVMPTGTQLQVFQRSFTTKGPGRGLGTYMMRLLSEHYLGGNVGFRSDAETGTVFTARYPLAAREE